jgi:hypothetical protein
VLIADVPGRVLGKGAARLSGDEEFLYGDGLREWSASGAKFRQLSEL